MNILTKIHRFFFKSDDEIIHEAEEMLYTIGLDGMMLDSAREKVHAAETIYKDPGTGRMKEGWVRGQLEQAWKTAWPNLKPHVYNIVIGLAVQLLKKGVKL